MAAKKTRPAYLQKAIRSLSDNHLKAFYTLANSVEFDALKEVSKNVQHNTMVSFFQLDHLRDPKYLAQEGGFAKGTIFGINTLVRIIELSPEEVDRREGSKKRSKSK